MLFTVELVGEPCYPVTNHLILQTAIPCEGQSSGGPLQLLSTSREGIFMRKVLVLFFALACCSVLSSAQKQKPAALDKLDVFGGYSYSRVYAVNEGPFPDPMSLNGGQASVTYYFMRHVGATAEFAAYTDDLSTINGTFNTQGYLVWPFYPIWTGQRQKSAGEFLCTPTLWHHSYLAQTRPKR